MKALRSPWVSGVLAVAAAGVIYFQVIKPQMDRRGPIRPKAVAGTVTTAAKSAKAKTAPPAKPAAKQTAVTSKKFVLEDGSVPRLPMDRTAASERFARWAEAPARDPFLLIPPAEVNADGSTIGSPIAQWRLSGIWRQTGSRVAAINSGVYTEGETVQGFKLAKIENDQVWLQVSNKLERLSLGGPITNAPAKPAKTR